MAKTKKLLDDLARTVVKEAQKLAPKVTGELRQSIEVASVTDEEATVKHGNSARLTVITANHEHIIYPIFVHEGTAAHTIEPKNKKALAWGRGDNRMVRRKVLHPGTKAQPYFSNAIKSPEIDRVISEYGDEVVKDLSISVEGIFKKLI
ncbi:MAG: HK97 gp10 family phage protein [Campylobacteraceae bacterium]|jgi:hypothetical protein|nr:HK97 gp10 family phage protein [Campylobacteraceae bacterium]